MRIVDDTERLQIILSATRTEDTLFRFAARVFLNYFGLPLREVNYFVRQYELTDATHDARVPELIRTMGAFFELDRKEVRRFYQRMQEAGKVPS